MDIPIHVPAATKCSVLHGTECSMFHISCLQKFGFPGGTEGNETVKSY